jgi:hypothetical protein
MEETFTEDELREAMDGVARVICRVLIQRVIKRVVLLSVLQARVEQLKKAEACATSK